MKLLLLMALVLNCLVLGLMLLRQRKQERDTTQSPKEVQPKGRSDDYCLMGESKGSPKLFKATIGSPRLSKTSGNHEASNFVPEEREASPPSEEDLEVYDPLGAEEVEDRLLEEDEELALILGEPITLSEQSLTLRELGYLQEQLRSPNELKSKGQQVLAEFRAKVDGTAFMDLFSAYEAQQENLAHKLSSGTTSEEGSDANWRDFL